jgi:hypothetical protein
LIVTNASTTAPSSVEVVFDVITGANAITSFGYQTANTFLASPDQLDGSPSFRTIVSNDIPNLDTSKITSGTFADDKIPNLNASKITAGTLAVARGGTGQTTLALARNAMGLGNTTGAVPIANGGTGATTAAAARTNLGLGNVDNTSDANKPVSTAQQTALNGKLNLTGGTITANSLTSGDALSISSTGSSGTRTTGKLFSVTSSFTSRASVNTDLRLADFTISETNSGTNAKNTALSIFAAGATGTGSSNVAISVISGDSLLLNTTVSGTLTVTNNVNIAQDKNLNFGSGGDAFINYDPDDLLTMTNTAGQIIINAAGGLINKTSFTTKAATTGSVATQIPVFTANPASTEQTIVTRTPAQLLSDIGAATSSHQHGYLTSTGVFGGSPATVASSDRLVITDASDTSKMNYSSIAFGTTTDRSLLENGTWGNPVQSTSAFRASDLSLTTATNVLTVAIPRTGTYRVFMSGAYYSSNTSIGVQISFTSTASMSSVPDPVFNITAASLTTSSAGALHRAVPLNTAVITPSVSNTNSDIGMSAMGVFRVLGTGDFSLRMAPETGSTSVGVSEGTYISIERIGA